MKNDVREIVPRLKGKLVIDSTWMYKVKHAANGSIISSKLDFRLEVSPRERKWNMRRLLLLLPGIPPSNSLSLALTFG